jgi:hypothetical protein
MFLVFRRQIFYSSTSVLKCFENLSVRNLRSTWSRNVCIKVKVRLTLEQATEAQMGSRSTALLFFKLGAIGGWVVNATSRPLCPGEWPSTPCMGGWVGPTVSLNGCRKSYRHREALLYPSDVFNQIVQSSLSTRAKQICLVFFCSSDAVPYEITKQRNNERK